MNPWPLIIALISFLFGVACALEGYPHDAMIFFAATLVITALAPKDSE